MNLITGNKKQVGIDEQIYNVLLKLCQNNGRKLTDMSAQVILSIVYKLMKEDVK